MVSAAHRTAACYWAECVRQVAWPPSPNNATHHRLLSEARLFHIHPTPAEIIQSWATGWVKVLQVLKVESWAVNRQHRHVTRGNLQTAAIQR